MARQGPAAAGIPHFRKMLHRMEKIAAALRSSESGNVAAFLCSSLAAATMKLPVDSGYNILGMTGLDD
jgi:enoyl-[acyl-carrier-protein] reductase (NADH)